MNFDQDYKEFVKHEKTNCGTAGPVDFTIEEDVAIRLFVAYLNCRYAESYLTRKFSRPEKPCYFHDAATNVHSIDCANIATCISGG